METPQGLSGFPGERLSAYNLLQMFKKILKSPVIMLSEFLIFSLNICKAAMSNTFDDTNMLYAMNMEM